MFINVQRTLIHNSLHVFDSWGENLSHKKGYKVKVNQSHYRPEVPRGFQELRFPDYVTMTQDGGKVVSLTHWPLLPPGKTPGTYFCYRLSHPPRPQYDWKDFMSMKNSSDTIWI